MEQSGHDQQRWVSWVVVSVCVGLFLGGLLVWRVFLTQKQSVTTPFEHPVSNGTVAGASVESTALPSPTFPASTQIPAGVPVLVTAQPTQVLSATTTPLSTVSLSPTLFIPLTPALYIGLQNGDFSESTRYWEQRGAVTVLPLSQAEYPEQFEGIESYVQLASATSLEWLGAHVLEQKFRAPADHTALEFWYRIHTEETEFGFDSPCLVVLVNEQAVAWFSAADANESWHSYAVPLPLQHDEFTTITFSVGQTGDQTKATWVDLANVYTLPEAPFQTSVPPLPLDSQLRVSFTDTASIGLSLESETPAALMRFTQKLNTALLLPELALQQPLRLLSWQPDGTHYQPAITSPDFYGTQSGLYAPDAENPWNLPVQLNQLKDHNQLLPVKLWLVVKTALDEVLQLVQLNY